MESFIPILNAIDSFMWGPPLITLLVGTGIYLTIRLKLLQVFRLPKALKLIFKAQNNGRGDVSSFKALCVALAATVGVRRHPRGRPGRHLLDVGRRLLRHGHEVFGGPARRQIPFCR